MSDFLNRMKSAAKADLKTIVLPEGEDPRTIVAATKIIEEGLAKIVILGNPDEINVPGATVIDPRNAEKHEEYAQKFAELRAKKGVTIEQARAQVMDATYFGTMMVKMGDADGLVSGACHSTADTLRPALQILKTAPGTKLVSAFFVMCTDTPQFGTDGTLTVIRDLQMKEPYIGSTKLVSGEIGDDVTAYFAQSEQTPTACALGVLVDRDQSVKVAGGYLLQLLPGAPDEVIDTLEKGISRAGAVTPMLEAGMTPEDILGQVCGSLGVAFLETTEVTYKCYCTRERVERALISLGRKELEEIRQEGKTFPVECQFCDAVYSFTPVDIGKLLEKI